jgi:uncharacterized repeat protein (TIGR01451 family)
MRAPTTDLLRKHGGPSTLCLSGKTKLMSFAFMVALVSLSLIAPRVASATSTPHWIVLSQPGPTQFHPGDSSDFYEVFIRNDGGANTTGPTTVTDVLPQGVELNSAYRAVSNGYELRYEPVGCEQAPGSQAVTCTAPSVSAGQDLDYNFNVKVSTEAAGTLTNSVTVSGGGAPEVAQATNETLVTPSGESPFGASLVAGIGGDTQAGSHPLDFTTLIGFNIARVDKEEVPNQCDDDLTPSCAALNAQAKDIEVALPPGLVGNPTAVPYCKQPQFETGIAGCPVSSQVGSLRLYFYGNGTAQQYAPVYNIEPPEGEPGELGFSVSTVAHISLFFHVRSDGDYGLTANISNINQFDPVRAAVLSIWGNPADEVHNTLRESKYHGHCITVEGGCPSGILTPRPFLTLPTSCPGGSFAIPLVGDSWREPTLSLLANASVPGMRGCAQLPFHPSIGVETSTHQAGAPAGYDVDLKVPQNEEVGGLATSDVRNVEVVLPEGTILSPSAANGLTACSEAEFGLKVRANGSCPNASKVGTVKIMTPLLTQPVTGNVFVGEPECSPCDPEQAKNGQMIRLFVEAEGAGVIIKLTGHTKINQNTGQLTTVFTDNPQLPFSDLVLSVDQGPSAPLVNPSTCGPALTSAAVTPWSSNSLVADDILAPAIAVEGCGSPGFAPTFHAGTTDSAHGGAFTGFAVTLSRGDGEQRLGRVSVTTPRGLLGVLKSVEQCGEAQANAGTCPAASQIGTGSIIVGPGSAPLSINGTRVYLTGPYEGRPFGLSIVTPAVAGPFVLSGDAGNGNEVVRASIAVDPHTSALTVQSDPLPQELNGVPLDIRGIDIEINRGGFMFNPTNCDAMSVTGQLTSTTGTTDPVSYPFQSSDCAVLPFKPKFTAVTQGKASKKRGASLHVRVVSGAGQANVAQVKVNLPIQLPSRNSTLQKACSDSTFEANPASCSSESVVGQATAVTPLLKGPLTGPAYIVSHAGRSFPDLDIVLQGEGITLILTGNTDIKKGVTSSAFKAVPDAPINTFDLVLPEGPHSILAAFGNLCTGKLNMPTQITGQNGAVIKQTTKIGAIGCPKHKAA